MSKYLVKRVLLAILSILIVSAITFFVMNLIPGGPFNKEKATSKEAQQVLEERYNLDKPERMICFSGYMWPERYTHI